MDENVLSTMINHPMNGSCAIGQIARGVYKDVFVVEESAQHTVPPCKEAAMNGVLKGTKDDLERRNEEVHCLLSERFGSL